MNKVDTEKKSIDKEYLKFVFEFTLHEDKLFTSRLNLFLVTESLLFIAYISLFTNVILLFVLISNSFLYAISLRSDKCNILKINSNFSLFTILPPFYIKTQK